MLLMLRSLLLLLFLSLSLANPIQVRLGFIPSGMRISWAQNNTVKPRVKVNGLVYSGTLSTYGTYYFASVDIKPLLPNKQYTYYINNYKNTFTTASLNKPFTTLVVGDIGIRNSNDTIELMKHDDSDWILHLGDVAYADDWFSRLEPPSSFEKTWNTWQNWMEPITSKKPYMVLPGNHDAACAEAFQKLCPKHQQNFTTYRYRFDTPWKESGGVKNMYYSFDYGNVHFINIDTETDFPDAPNSNYNFGNRQLKWLEKDLLLANANRLVRPWIIVSGHRPFYTSHSLTGKQCTSCRKAFEPLFLKYKVDIYLSAHIHYYERLYVFNKTKIYKEYDKPSMPVYLINGAGGNVEGHDHYLKKEKFTAKILEDYGFGRLKVDGRRIDWEFLSTPKGKVVDRITITK